MLKSSRLTTNGITKYISLNCLSQTHWFGNRTRPDDYSPTPSRALPRKPFIPPRKRKSFAVDPTPTMEPFKDDFPTKKQYEPIRLLFGDSATDSTARLESRKTPIIINNPEQAIVQDTVDDSDAEEDQDAEDPLSNIHREIWPYKKWLWRTDKNLANKTFSAKQQLETFIDDGDNHVGRVWYVHELRLKSNEDLWRLWYVLLREKNMLQSLRFQCRAAKRLMPNYGRFRKVNKSMGRVKQVWFERAKLKHENRELEHEQKDEQLRTQGIEYRRLKMLTRREKVKELFEEHVQQLISEGKDVTHLFPRQSKKKLVGGDEEETVVEAAGFEDFGGQDANQDWFRPSNS